MLTDFKLGEKIRYTVLLKLQKIGTSTAGTNFARGTIQDNSGVINFISFESRVTEFLKDVPIPAVLTVSGNIDINKFAGDGSLQLMLHNAEWSDDKENLAHLLPYTPKNIEQYEQKLTHIIDGISNRPLQQLVKEIFAGEVYVQYVKNPAAMRFHHAYIGGLLEHSVDVALLANQMAKQVGNVDMDLVAAGALLHDVGKIKEISSEIGFSYTETGRMLGHIFLGSAMIEKAAEKIEDLSLATRQHLVHIVLSHHGTIEKGSPVACATKESFIVHYADEFNAIMNQFDVADKVDWQFSKMLNRHIYHTNENK